MRRLFALSLLIAGAAAPAFAQSPEPPKLEINTAAKGCTPAAPGEVVVCGESPDKYRIDADVLQVIRRQEQAANPPRPPVDVASGDPCKVGPNGCPGEGALPLLMIAMKVAQVGVTAIKGEDWREPLRTRPDDYRLYQEEKAKREDRRVRVGIEFGARPKVERPGH